MHSDEDDYRSTDSEDADEAPTLDGPTGSSKEATEALMAALQKITKHSREYERDGFRVRPDEDNLYRWEVDLFGFDANTQICDDLRLYARETGRPAHVKLEILFPADYPRSPPYIRVVRPRFHQWTGHITIGGSVCIKDLTRSGWNPKYDLSSFIVMIRNLLLEGGALVDMDQLSDYTPEEAREAFHRVAQQHGWRT